MEQTREHVGPSRPDNTDGGEEYFVSLPRPRPVGLIDQFSAQGRERTDLAQSSTEGE